MTLNQFIDFAKDLKVGDKIKYKRRNNDTIFKGRINSLPKRQDHWDFRSGVPLTCPSVILDQGISIDHPRFKAIGEDVLNAEEGYHDDYDEECKFEWITLDNYVPPSLDEELFIL